MSKFAIQVDVIRGTHEHGTPHDDFRVLYNDGTAEEFQRESGDALAMAIGLLPDCTKNGRLCASKGAWLQIRKVGGSRLIEASSRRDTSGEGGVKLLSFGELAAIEQAAGKKSAYSASEYRSAVAAAATASGCDAWCDKIEADHLAHNAEHRALGVWGHDPRDPAVAAVIDIVKASREAPVSP